MLQTHKNDQSGAYTEHSATAPAVAELRDVSKLFGDVKAVVDMNLSITQGEFFTFLGPSGCGKTTALRMLAGFETPTKGAVLIDGEDVSALEPYRRPVNMVFQSYALFPHLTVGQNIAYGLKQQKPKPGRSMIDEKVGRALETVRLAGFESRRIWEMSGGQQQRVALARAIVNEPKLLLLDEPLAALDRKLRKEMQIELQDLQRDLGITFVLVTHDQEEALSLSDRICVVRAGEIIQVGAPQELYDRPNTRYVADFVGSSNFFNGSDVEVSDDTASIVLNDGRRYTGTAMGGISSEESGCLSVRPEQIHMSRNKLADALECQILNRIFLGEHTEYLVRQKDLGNIAVLAPRRSDEGLNALEKGDIAWVSWANDGALILKND